MSCDGSPDRVLCYTALSVHSMPQSSPSKFDAQWAAAQNSQSQEPRFLDHVARACRVKHLAYGTEQSYVAWVKRFILFHNKRYPQEMGPTEVRAFLTHLAVNRRVSSSTQNQALTDRLHSHRMRPRNQQQIGSFLAERNHRISPGCTAPRCVPGTSFRDLTTCSRNVNATTNGEDRTPIELFVAGVRGWQADLRWWEDVDKRIFDRRTATEIPLAIASYMM